jgi:hypothetical protein
MSSTSQDEELQQGLESCPSLNKYQYEQNGPEAQRIAAVIPYFPFKGIPRFYDIGGFLARPDLLQLVIDIFASRYESMEIDSILGYVVVCSVTRFIVALFGNKNNIRIMVK